MCKEIKIFVLGLVNTDNNNSLLYKILLQWLVLLSTSKANLTELCLCLNWEKCSTWSVKVLQCWWRRGNSAEKEITKLLDQTNYRSQGIGILLKTIICKSGKATCWEHSYPTQAKMVWEINVILRMFCCMLQIWSEQNDKNVKYL